MSIRVIGSLALAASGFVLEFGLGLGQVSRPGATATSVPFSRRLPWHLTSPTLPHAN